MYIDEPKLCKEFLDHFRNKSQFYKKCTHKPNLNEFQNEIALFELFIESKNIA